MAGLEGRAVQPQHGCGSDLTGERLAPGKLFARGLGLQRPRTSTEPLCHTHTPFSRCHRFFSLALPHPPPQQPSTPGFCSPPDLGKENLLIPTYLSPKDLVSFSYTGQNPGLVPASHHPCVWVPFSVLQILSKLLSPTSAETATWSHGRSGDTLCVAHGSNCDHKPQAKPCLNTLQEASELSSPTPIGRGQEALV